MTKAVQNEDGTWGMNILYDDATVDLFRLEEDGRIGPLVDVIKHTGLNPGYLLHAHPHSAVWDPSGRFFAVCDKGEDAIYCYRIAYEQEKLVPMGPPYQEEKGSAPRHCLFHPTKPYFYCNHEGNLQLSAFRYDASGQLELLESVYCLPKDKVLPKISGRKPGLKPTQQCLALSRDGRFLYDVVNGKRSRRGLCIPPGSGHRTAGADSVSPGGRTVGSRLWDFPGRRVSDCYLYGRRRSCAVLSDPGGRYFDSHRIPLHHSRCGLCYLLFPAISESFYPFHFLVFFFVRRKELIMKHMKKSIAFILAAVMLFGVLAGCGSSSSSSTSSSDSSNSGSSSSSDANSNELIIGCSSDIGSMYPFGSATSGVKAKRLFCYETLFWKDYDGELEPLLAKSYEDLGDGKYSIELFDYIYDSEGNHMTASDIVFTLDKYIEDGQNLTNYSTLISYEATGDYTLELQYDPEDVGQFTTLVTNMHCVCQAAWESTDDDMASYPIGTGGYVLDTDNSIAGSTYVFTKRDDYWQTDEQYINDRNRQTLDKATVKIITDTSTLAIALQTGEIDYTSDIASADRGLFTNDDGTAATGYVELNAPNNAFCHLLFNCSDNSPCADINVRRAICYAIDAAACAANVCHGFGSVCNAPTNPNLLDSDESMGSDDYFNYDPDYAEELLADSSYNGETISILVQPTEFVKDCAVLVQQYLAQVGINCELQEYEMALYRTTRKDETGTLYDIELYGSAGTGDSYVYTSLQELDQDSYDCGMSQIHIPDDTLYSLFQDVASINTNSPETVKAFLDYVTDRCYVYGLYYESKYLFGSDVIKDANAVIYCDAVFNSFVVER